MKLSPLSYQLLGLLGAVLNLMSNGSVNGYPAVLLDQLQYSDEIPFDAESVSTLSWISGFFGLGGCLLAPLAMNRLGRKPAHIWSTVPITMGWILTAFASNITTLIVARVIHAIGQGFRAPISGILVAECTDPKYRGAFLSSFEAFHGLGILVSHLMGSLISWRLTAFALALIPVLSMFLIILSPESPSWLASKGHFEQCRENFVKLRGDGDRSNDELKKLILSQSKVIEKDEIKIWETVKHKYFYVPAIIVASLQVMFEFGGGHMMPAFINIILTSILNKSNVNLEITIIDAFRVLSSILAVAFVKQWRRRMVFIIGSLCTITTLAAMSVYMYLRNDDIIPDCRWFAMILYVIYTISFYFLVSLLNVIANELFPLKCRSFGMTCLTFTIIPLFMLSMEIAPILFRTVGVEGSFMIYVAILTISFINITCLMPETKDKTLQEIELYFEKAKPNCDDLEIKSLQNI